MKFETYLYIRSFLLIIVIDSLLIDDEPLWEPLEWSLVQTWLLFIYIFTWSAEVIFSSRYGSYTNRDKIVWIGLLKTYWLLQLWFMFNLFIVTVFITMPFYFEITYSVSYIVLWWNWYNSFFFFKLISFFSLFCFIFNLIFIKIRWVSFNFIFFIFLFFLFFIFYFLFFNFYVLFYGFFTDQLSFKKTSHLGLNKIINNPLKWDWGLYDRDNFAYHRTVSVFWYKTDPLIASSMLFLNFFLLFSLFFFFLKTVIFVRVIYSTKEVSFNFFSFFFNSFRIFFLFYIYIYNLVFISIIYHFIKFPFELYWFNKLFNIFLALKDFFLDFFLDFLI